MNLCVLFGIPFARAKFALADSCVSAVLHGATRQTVKGIIKIEAVNELSPAQAAWQLPSESAAEMQRFGAGTHNASNQTCVSSYSSCYVFRGALINSSVH